jgi:DNA-binding NtrC family response regulator
VLPAADELELAEDHAQAQSLQGGTERLLVVDDETSILSILQQRLSKLGYRIITRAESTEALETLRREPKRFDLVITDQSMPRLTGRQLRDEITHIRPDLPVIIMTGFGLSSLRELEGTSSPTALISKPIDFKTLACTLRQLLRQKS